MIGWISEPKVVRHGNVQGECTPDQRAPDSRLGVHVRESDRTRKHLAHRLHPVGIHRSIVEYDVLDWTDDVGSKVDVASEMEVG